MPTTKLPVGVIGLGRMGRIYADAIAHRISNARLVAIADVVEGVVQEQAELLEVPFATTDYRELLARPEVEAVFVISPTSTHREVVTEAARAGKAIFCEKPIALTLAETDAIAGALEQAGVFFQAGFMRRFDAGYAQAWAKIEAGVIGRPTTFKSIGHDPFCPNPAFADPAVSGGLILDMAIHDFDLARWLMQDEVKRVYAEGSLMACPELKAVGDIDNAVVTLAFERGAVGDVEVSRNAFYGYDIRTEVLGTEGALQIGYFRQTPVLTLTPEGVAYDMVPYIIERFLDAYVAQSQDFVNRVLAGDEPAVTIEDARRALAIGAAATQSLHEGRPITLEL